MASESGDVITILGFGSLLSERSSRLTFPELTNFRLGRIPNYRRVFGHPASIFFQRNIANMDTLEMSSLSAESGGPGFICAVFEVPNRDMMTNGIPSEAFLEREEEFNIITVPFLENGSKEVVSEGILCTRSTDEEYVRRWGTARLQKNYGAYGVSTIWGWEKDSGLKPCAIYLRHCVLAAESMGPECYASFLDETFLIDRKTTVRQYLEQNPNILTTLPPPELATRYGG
mmetsp:Transcript_20728/g.37466  ORF Transcript_20728/g.37466 Transcript_20728/m.37466 type:complete len:230 (-) Transcript_20728:74-763(-)